MQLFTFGMTNPVTASLPFDVMQPDFHRLLHLHNVVYVSAVLRRVRLCIRIIQMLRPIQAIAVVCFDSRRHTVDELLIYIGRK